MVWLLVGVAVGCVLALPMLPLLPVTEPAFARAAAGIAMIGVVLFAIRFWTLLDGAEEHPVRGVALFAYETAGDVGAAFAVAVLVAALGVTSRRRI